MSGTISRIFLLSLIVDVVILSAQVSDILFPLLLLLIHDDHEWS